MHKFNMFITFLVLPVYWIRAQFLAKFGSEAAKQREMKRYPKHYLGFRRIKVVAHGTQPPANIPCIYISNHQSANDIFVMIAATNRPFKFIAKKELFESFITNPFMRMTGSYALDRDDARKSLLILKQAVKNIEKGHSVLAFPEGTRSHQKDMLEFKDGIFSMLKKSKVPIVPMYIKESYNEKQKTINVYIGDAIESKTYIPMKGQELSYYTFNKMNDLKAKAYS